MKPSDKTAITLDIAISPSHRALWLWHGVMVLVWLICLAVGMVWWQWLILLLVSMATAWHYYRTRHAISHMSCTHYDGVWLLAQSASANRLHLSTLPIRQSSTDLANYPPHPPHPTKPSIPKPLIYQAYLNDCQWVNLGVAQAVVLKFFVIIPQKSALTVVLFEDQLSSDDFAKLTALACWAYR